ncbi:MAG: hypothetical protein IJH94_02160 [Clostridia bacterium]|nr:hypothetical protein [Clostridia bacterium]
MRGMILLSAALTVLISSCGDIGSGSGSGRIDVDLTRLSSTMVYSEVYNMMNEPEDYVGKVIRMDGNLNIYPSEETNKVYYACIVADATACCAQGIEFAWAGEHEADDYPAENTLITVVGTFDSYDEDGMTYYHLRDAKMSF